MTPFSVFWRRRQRSSARGRVVARSPRAMGGFNLADTSVTTSLKYGLNASAKRKPAKAPARPLAAFADADDDDDGPSDAAGARVRANAEVARQQAAARDDARARALHAAALQQDASVFEYDAHHDAHRDARREAQREADAERVDRESKYVETLMRRRDEREREDAVLRERRLVREREREDHLYGDKERFVTNAYKNKLKEDAAWLAEDAKRDEKDALAFSSAARRGDFQSSFYGGGRVPVGDGGVGRDAKNANASTKSTNTIPKKPNDDTAALDAALHDKEEKETPHDTETDDGATRLENRRGADGAGTANASVAPPRTAANGGNGHERAVKSSIPLKRTTIERSITETETTDTSRAAVAVVAESANRAESAKALAARARFLERKRRKE